MTTFCKCVRIFIFPIITGIVLACGTKKDNPDPVTPIDQYKEVHVNVIQNIVMNRNNSNFQGDAFYNEDRSIGHGLDVVAYSLENSRLSTTTWSANSDNIQFILNIHKDNITYGNNSVKGGEYYIAAKKVEDPIMTFNAKDSTDLKLNVELITAEKTKILKHVKKINLFAPIATDGGIRIRGSSHANNEVFLNYIANIANIQNTKNFAARRYLSIENGSNPSYTVIP